MRAAILHCTLGAMLCAAGVACTPTPPATTVPEPAVSEPDSVRPSSVGTPDPLRLVDADPNGRWVAMCQARHDTNGDGKTSVSFGHHGERYGDAWRPYLAFGSAELAVGRFGKARSPERGLQCDVPVEWTPDDVRQ